MKTLLETVQDTWDDLDKKGELDDSFKEKYPRPETLEDVEKLFTFIQPNNGLGFLLTLMILPLLFGGGWGYSNQNLEELKSQINKESID